MLQFRNILIAQLGFFSKYKQKKNQDIVQEKAKKKCFLQLSWLFKKSINGLVLHYSLKKSKVFELFLINKHKISRQNTMNVYIFMMYIDKIHKDY